MTAVQTTLTYEQARWKSPAVSPVHVLRAPSSRITLTDPVRKWWDATRCRMDELTSLRPGWDGYSAPAVSLTSAFFAMRMLEAVCGDDTPAPQIVPGFAGDLQIEWHLIGGDLELHVRSANNVSAWRCTDATGPDGEELELTVNFKTIARWIDDLTGASRAAEAAAA